MFYRKHDTVFYQPGQRKGGTTVRARVATVHRDGSYTITALFYVRADGSDVPGYLGFNYRVDARMLRVSL